MRPSTLTPFPDAVVPMGVLLGLFCCLCGFWAAAAPGACAQSLTDRLTGSPKVPWQISADAVAYDAPSTTYHARGNVVIEKQSARLVADRVAFNHKAMTASATGNVVLTAGGDVITGDHVELDLNRETGVVHHGSVFLKENHFTIRGERIEKTGPQTYRAERASVTTCDGDDPDWVITGREVDVTIEGYGTATHAVFRARRVPLLYAPYLLFPAKTKRQSGLLIPEPGYSDRLGFYWDQPFFWAIGEASDATLYTSYMQERGTKIGLEYRWALSDDSFGAVMGDGLEDRRVDDGTPENTERWGYPDDAYDRPNQDRYWLRAKADQELPLGATARLDLDVVSDQDYLTEFRGGTDGYEATRDYFLSAFGRDLDTYDDHTRVNRLNVNRTWSRYAFNTDLLWNDNVVKRRWEETDDTLQRMPTVLFDSAKQEAFGSGVFWDLESEYTYFYREDGERGQRTDLYPRAYLPLRWENYLSVEPSAGWRQTYWQMDRWEDDGLERTSYRQIYDLELDLSTELSKVMPSPVAGVDRIRHSIKPQVVYTYIPEQDQTDLPYFTTIDRIDEANRITYSLTNTFTARRARSARRPDSISGARLQEEYETLTDQYVDADSESEDAAASEGDAGPHPPTPIEPFDYVRFCRFYLEQSYDIAVAAEDDERFSDLYGELDLFFGRYFLLSSDARFDTYDTRFSAHNVGLLLSDARGDRFSVAHRYRTDRYESLRGTLSLKVTDRLTVRGEYERDLLDGKDIVKGAGFLYTAQCWGIDFFYARETSDERYSLLIHLQGIGGLGR